jgi:hypothetical protein
MPAAAMRAVQFVARMQRRILARVIDGAHKAACILSLWVDSSGPALCGPRLKFGGSGRPWSASPNATEPPEENMQPGVQVARLGWWGRPAKAKRRIKCKTRDWGKVTLGFGKGETATKVLSGQVLA